MLPISDAKSAAVEEMNSEEFDREFDVEMFDRYWETVEIGEE